MAFKFEAKHIVWLSTALSLLFLSIAYRVPGYTTVSAILSALFLAIAFMKMREKNGQSNSYGIIAVFLQVIFIFLLLIILMEIAPNIGAGFR